MPWTLQAVFWSPSTGGPRGGVSRDGAGEGHLRWHGPLDVSRQQQIAVV